MATSSIRALVVDDFEPWRHHVCSVLQTSPELCVVAQGADGLEAVRKAQELNPDLILLDIGLPNLDGLEAANQIRQIAPYAKIIFLTQNSDREVVQAALNTGARGYVHKQNASTELLPAVEAVLRGQGFVSRELAAASNTPFEQTYIPTQPQCAEPLAASLGRPALPSSLSTRNSVLGTANSVKPQSKQT